MNRKERPVKSSRICASGLDDKGERSEGKKGPGVETQTRVCPGP